ncbi:MAG: thioredoxin family protein [Bacillota bacterium]
MSEGKIIKAKSKAVKIIIPILLLSIIFGIWAFKNSDKNSYTAASDNPDFELHVSDEINLEKLKAYKLPIIIDFGADSCIPCKEMAPILEELNKELRGKAIIKFVDVWKYGALAQNYPLRVIPTQVFIDADGKPFKPKDARAMQLLLYSSRETNEHNFTTHEGGMTKKQLLEILREMGLK